MEKPIFIPGGHHSDFRGVVSFVNDFHLDNVKRLYTIDHPNIDIVRAWQGHKVEQKWFCVVAGSFKMLVVKPDDWVNPSEELEVIEFTLSVESMGVLHIPGGYANGFKALEPNSKFIVFSNFSTEQSSDDNYRFDQNSWYDWNKA
ncbi:dTDP-4-dehydrorhamnose 3,5-epimerase [Pedobacter steynii]|uniref:dTDP-4-dehydrorhamnose 3,5-epimerase n=1 Tax=Pedobacter steynii TaxID=430522 RepID=A0A1G9WK68_9SPHI|nr:hypothetical protein [Pedobacter steynii]NQX40311.1 hypothetical protein [Pedobacter steynii]SDM84445.1 dTDP-4-dehydrorhamnose 3,5-epimerase [Pedobacter steynii]